MSSAKMLDLLDQIAQVGANDSSVEQARLLLRLAQEQKLSPGYLLQLATLNHSVRSRVQKHKQAIVRIDVCQGKACRAKGAEHLLEQLKNPNLIDVSVFSQKVRGSDKINCQVRACHCLKQCGQAPVVLIDGVLKGKFRLNSN